MIYIYERLLYIHGCIYVFCIYKVVFPIADSFFYFMSYCKIRICTHKYALLGLRPKTLKFENLYIRLVKMLILKAIFCIYMTISVFNLYIHPCIYKNQMYIRTFVVYTKMYIQNF